MRRGRKTLPLDINVSFRAHLERELKEYHSLYDDFKNRYWYNGDDDYDDIYTPYSSDFIDDAEYVEADYNYSIYFYEDINNKDVYIKFKNVSELISYCESHDIYVSKFERNAISWRSVSHCCIDPMTRNVEVYEHLHLMSDLTWADLYWSIHDSSGSVHRIDGDSVDGYVFPFDSNVEEVDKSSRKSRYKRGNGKRKRIKHKRGYKECARVKY